MQSWRNWLGTTVRSLNYRTMNWSKPAVTSSKGDVDDSCDGIEIDLESRVAPYYGDSIRRQSEEVLEALGIRHAHVKIHDEGALPFVIAARIEAAARRAGLGQGTRVLPERIALP